MVWFKRRISHGRNAREENLLLSAYKNGLKNQKGHLKQTPVSNPKMDFRDF